MSGAEKRLQPCGGILLQLVQGSLGWAGTWVAGWRHTGQWSGTLFKRHLGLVTSEAEALDVYFFPF